MQLAHRNDPAIRVEAGACDIGSFGRLAGRVVAMSAADGMQPWSGGALGGGAGLDSGTVALRGSVNLAVGGTQRSRGLGKLGCGALVAYLGALARILSPLEVVFGVGLGLAQ